MIVNKGQPLCFYSIITINSSTKAHPCMLHSITTANVIKHNLTTACFYSIITANVNKSLPLYISTA